MKKTVFLLTLTLLLGQSAMASHSIPVAGCNNGKIVSSDNGNLYCLSREIPCDGKIIQLSVYDEGGPGMACVKDCQYIDRAEGGEGLTCFGSSGN